MKAKSKTYSVVYAHTRAKNDDGTDDSKKALPSRSTSRESVLSGCRRNYIRPKKIYLRAA